MAFCGFIYCCEILLHFDPSASGRMQDIGTHGPNDLAVTLVFLFPFVLTLFEVGRKLEKVWAASVGALFYGAIFITGSRAGLIGWFSVILAWTVGYPRDKLRTKVLVLIISLGSLFFMPADFASRCDDAWTGRDYNYHEPEGRIAIWERGIRLFFAHIPTGVGIAQDSIAMGVAYGSYLARAAHNIFLQVALDLGITGLALFTFILYSIWDNIRKSLSAIAAGKSPHLRALLINARLSLLGFLVCGQFHSQAYAPIIPFLLAFSSSLARLGVEGETNGKLHREHTYEY